MNLYEINQQILDCIDPETGEIVCLDRLEELNMKKAEKVDNIACWIKNLEADVAAFEAQEKAFAERKAAAKHKIEGFKVYLTDALCGQNFSSERCAVNFRRSKAFVDYEESCLLQIRSPPAPLSARVNVRCIYYMATRRKVDLANLIEATCDILVRAGVLEDDNSRIVAAHDGSRVEYDKENPRAEIWIEEMEEKP